MEKNYGISLLRFMAMLLIVTCHIFQALGNIICYYLNIGVWIFLFMSGYIYGKREITDITAFYKKRAIRILIPYYIMLAVIIIANICHGASISLKDLLSSILCLQWYGYTVPNCGHLWYISCILFCYLITPILQWIAKQQEKSSLKFKCIFFVLAVFFLQLCYSLGGMKQATTSILPYIMGYFIAVNCVDEYPSIKNKMGGGISYNFGSIYYTICM